MANLHWKPVPGCDSPAGLTIACEFKSRYVLRGMPRGSSIEKGSGCRGSWLDAESGISWPRVATDSTKLTIPAQTSNPPRPRAFLSVEIRVFTGLRLFEWFGLGCQDNQSTVDVSC